MWRIAPVAVLLCACELYLPTPGTGSYHAPPSSPDASLNDPACGGDNCEAGRHCVIECSKFGPAGCVYNCHVTCEPDTACSTVDTCMPPTICVDTCFDTCQAMPDLCQLTCEMPDGSCQQIADEASCMARSDCMPIYRASDCTCSDQDCTCTNEMVSFARCDSTGGSP